MKPAIFLGLAILGAFRLARADQGPSGAVPDPAAAAVAMQPVELKPTQIQNIVLSLGVITTIKIESEKKIDRVLIGAPIITVKVDEELGRIDLVPKTQSGATNMIVTIGGTDYVFIVQISPKLQSVVYTRTYTIGQSGFSEEQQADLMRLGKAPILKPSQINILKMSEVIERARIDAVYRQSLLDYRQTPIDRVYQWNGCLVHLLEVNSFLDSDTLCFKVQWVNTTASGIYLHARQIKLRTQAKAVDVKARMQDSPTAWVLPGQMDTVWLVVQGERMAPSNDWSIELPPDAVALGLRTVSR